MFRGFFAGLLSLIPVCWRFGHRWRTEPLRYDARSSTATVDRVCSGCGRRERRKHVLGPRSGDAAEIIPDPFTGWELVRSK